MSKEEKRKRLSNLHIDLISLVDEGANQEANVVLVKAQWPTAFINNLPDSSFAVIEAGGKKDDEGKTVPRTLRHFPYKDASGKVDLPHLRNALSRLPQSDLPSNLKAKAQAKLRAAAESAGVGKGNTKETNEMEETQKQLDELQSQLGELQKKLTEAEEARTAEVSAREAAEAKVADLEKRVAELQPKPDPVEKALAEIPEPVRKRLEETEAELSKMRDERDIEVRKAFLGQVENLKLGLEDGAQFLQRVAKALKPEDYAKFEEVLKAANEAAKTMAKPVGRSGHGAPHSVQDEVFAKADAFVKDGTVKTRDEGIQLALTDPELYKRYSMETSRKEDQ